MTYLFEWSIILFSWTAFGLFFYRINAANAVGQFFTKTSGYGYFKLQNIAFWSLVLNYSLSFCIALGTLKFLKIFRFNKRISFLASTLSNCFHELKIFCIIFGFIYYDIMLGKFQVQPLLQADFFCIYNVFIIFVLLKLSTKNNLNILLIKLMTFFYLLMM